MKKFFTLLVAFLFSFYSVSAISYDNKVYTSFKDQPGYWFDEPTTDLMLKDLSELKILRQDKIPAFEKKIALQELAIENYKIQLELSDSISKNYEKALDKSEKNYQVLEKKYIDQINRNDTWYKSPAFFFTLGIISGGLMAVGLSFGFRSN